MGSTQSIQDQVPDSSSSSSENQEQEDDIDDDVALQNSLTTSQLTTNTNLLKKVLEQEPEILPCYSSASPLSPQLSSLGTPRLGPSIKVWDPYNVLAPPLPIPASIVGFENSEVLEVYLISEGESEVSMRGEVVVGGRCHVAALTGNGKRQGRALAVLLNSQGVRFNAVYCSSLDRARSMAVAVCQEMNFAEEQIRPSDALMDMSMGQWEGCPRSEIYTPEVSSMVEVFQPDFCAPSGESLRQVEYRMVQFLNGTVLGLPEKLRSDFSLHHQNESQGFSHDKDGPSMPPPHWDVLNRHRPGLTRKKSGKSRLQFVTSTGNHETEDEISPRESNHQSALHDLRVRTSASSISSCVGVFTHAIPIKCLLTGLLGCSAAMSHKICIDDSSVTVIQHSWRTGWQIKRLNDTSHLRLL